MLAAGSQVPSLGSQHWLPSGAHPEVSSKLPRSPWPWARRRVLAQGAQWTCSLPVSLKCYLFPTRRPSPKRLKSTGSAKTKGGLECLICCLLMASSHVHPLCETGIGPLFWVTIFQGAVPTLHGLKLVVVQSLRHVQLFATPWTAARQISLSFTTLGVCSNSCLLSRWCHPTTSSSVISFSSYPQSFPASRSFPMSQLFASGGQNIGASASVLPVNIQCWFP